MGMAPPNCTEASCSNCHAVNSVDTEVHVKHSEENRYEFAVPCSNRYERLGDHGTENSKRDVEVCFTASIVKKLNSDPEYWKVDKNKSVCILRRSNKPVIILRHDADIWKALVNTGAERCLLNYNQYKCLKNEQIIDGDIEIKGGTGTSNMAIGEVELELQLSQAKA